MRPPSPQAVETPERLVGPVFTCVRLPVSVGCIRLMLVGELDLVTAGRAREAVRSAQDESRVLICDLGDVWFVDLAGLRVLVDATARAKLTGRRLAVANCPPIVPRMLRLLGLDDALESGTAPLRAASTVPRCAVIRPHVS